MKYISNDKYARVGTSHTPFFSTEAAWGPMVPAVTTLLGWPNYGPYGTTHRHNSTGLAELWVGWPIELEFACCSIMFGYGVNQLFNLLLFPNYLPQAYSPLEWRGCVGSKGQVILFWERLVIILAGGPRVAE